MELNEISCNCLSVLETDGLEFGGIVREMHEESLTKVFAVKVFPSKFSSRLWVVLLNIYSSKVDVSAAEFLKEKKKKRLTRLAMPSRKQSKGISIPDSNAASWNMKYQMVSSHLLEKSRYT